jgi:hypothetical protein
VTSLGVTAEELERAAEAEQRVVVRGRLLDDRLELGGRLLVALRAKERAPQRLADRRLVRLQVARTGQRDGGGVEVTVLQQARTALEEVVDALHHPKCTAAPARSEGPPGDRSERRQRRQRT